MYSYNDFLRESAKHLEYHEGNLQKYTDLINEGQKKIAKLDSQRGNVLVQMVEAITPNFSSEELAKLSKLLHNETVAKFAEQMKAEKEQNENRLKEINADPEFIQREILLHPTTGEYAVEHTQAKAAFERADKDFAKYKKYAYEFEDLIKDKYDTDEYEHTGILRFFNGEHLDNWRIGDILCEAFGYERFAPLREKYLLLKGQLEELYEAFQYYDKKIKYINNIVSEHHTINNRIPQLPTIYKKKLAEEIEAFLESTSTDSSKTFFAAYPDLDSLGKTHHGLNAQRKYLIDLQTKMQDEKSEINLKKTKLQKEVNIMHSHPHKYINRKWEPAKIKKRFNRNSEYMNSRFNKYHKTQQTIYSFNNYHAAPSMDIFWWDLINGKNKNDGSFSKNIKDHHNSHTHDKENYEPVNRGDNNFSNDNS